jgi:hypothetical protein
VNRTTRRPWLAAPLAAIIVAAGCTDRAPESGRDALIGQQNAPWLAITGATLIDGTGRDPIADAVLLIRDGRVHDAGPAGTIEIPPDTLRLDYRGAWIIPGLINAHGHVGTADGLHGGPAVHTEANVLAQLGLYARSSASAIPARIRSRTAIPVTILASRMQDFSRQARCCPRTRRQKRVVRSMRTPPWAWSGSRSA